MRPFEGLSARGKVLRLGGLARAAADAYGVDVARLALVGESFNTVFRIRSGSGAAYLLRVGAALCLHPAGSATVEAAWLDSLAVDTAIPVARVFRNRDGAVVTETVSPGVPEPRTCMLFGWIPGTAISDRLDPELAMRSGRLLAELHAHAAGSGVSAEGVPVADRVLYLNDPPLLGVAHPRHGTLFRDAADRAQAAIDALWAAPPHRPQLLHGDFTPANIISTRRGLAPIDFQDLIVGFDIQDLAISLVALQRFEGAASLTAGFRAGYESVRSWPDVGSGTLDALFAARRLLVLNLSLNLRKPGLGTYVDTTAARIADWMRSR